VKKIILSIFISLIIITSVFSAAMVVDLTKINNTLSSLDNDRSTQLSDNSITKSQKSSAELNNEASYTENTVDESFLISSDSPNPLDPDPPVPLGLNDPWWNSSWQYRRNMNITNNNNSVIIPEDFTINFTTNTTGDKYLDNGDDVRIVWWNGTDNIELDRINKTAFNSSNTEIAFKLQTNISAGGYDDSYHIYYGNPSAINPPNNGSNVYFYEDLFNRAVSSTVGYGWIEQETGSADARIAPNVLVTTNVLDLYGTNNSMDCIALHSVNGLSNRFVWEYGFVWDRDSAENHYEVYMQLGNS